MTEVHTDGNGVAGLLSEVLAVEVTTMQRRSLMRSQNCGARGMNSWACRPDRWIKQS